MYLATNLKYLRIKNGYSQDDIANKLGYKSFTTVQKWESGISEPSIQKLQTLASLFNIDIDDLANKDLANPIPFTNNKPNYHLTNDEITHVEKYRAIDNLARALVDAILDREYERIAAPALMAAHNDHIDEPDEQAKVMNDLRNLKKPN